MRTLGLLSCAFAAVSVASAQPYVKLIYSTDPNLPAAVSEVPGLPGVKWDPGTATNFDRPYASPNGALWTFGALADLTTADDEVIVLGSGPSGAGAMLVMQEGTATPFDPARLWGPIDQKLSINDAGQIVFINDLTGVTTDDEVIIKYNMTTFDSIVYQESDTVKAGEFLAGADFGSIFTAASIFDDGTVSAIIELDATGLTTANDNFVVVDPNIVLAQEGVTIPGGGASPWDLFDTGDLFWDATGSNWIILGDDEGNTATDKIAAVNGVVVLREGDTISGLSSPIAAAGIDEVNMTSNGDWLARGNNTNADEDWVVRNGSVLHKGLDPIFPGANEQWDDTEFADLFFWMGGNCQGDYVVGGLVKNIADPGSTDLNRDAVLVLNGKREVLRQGDQIDADGDGILNDNMFVHIFNNDDGFLTADGLLYLFVDTKFDPLATAATDQAFIVVRVFCPGDIDRDGDVDQSDLNLLLAAFNSGPGGDTDCDGDTDQSDLNNLLANFESCVLQP